MWWIITFRLRQYWLSSLWIIPVVCVVCGVLFAHLMSLVDTSLTTPETLRFSEGTAVGLLAAIFAGTISFTGFIFTMLLLLPQFGGSQLSARVLHLIYRDPVLKLGLGVFIGTMTYAFVVMGRTRDGFVPGVSLWVGGALTIFGIIFFLAILSRFVLTLRPATAAARVARVGRKVVLHVYQEAHGGVSASQSGGDPLPSAPLAQRILNTGEGGVILGVSVRALVTVAGRNDCVFVMPHAVGDYVATGTPMLDVYGANAGEIGPLIRRSIVLGPERTMDQDPAFALRILVDIAAKALSPAINDPTTAVNVIDRIEDLLVLIAGRRLVGGTFRDSNGQLRVLAPVPKWEDYLTLAVTEIRQYGATSVQVVRRLRAMLNELEPALPGDLRGSIHEEKRKLDLTIARAFPDDFDRAFAAVADAQGTGKGQPQPLIATPYKASQP